MTALTALFDLNGTATRKQAFRVLLVLIGAYLLVLGLKTVAPDLERYAYPALGLAAVWSWATLVRRFHDAGRSGAWAVLAVVPYLGLVVWIVALFLRSDRPFNDSHAGLRAAGTVALLCVAILFAARAFWGPYWIPTESMKPTLLVGDYFLARLGIRGDLQRGDVLVFRHPVNGSYMVARLIGLPGDKVQMQAGVPMFNDIPLTQSDEGIFLETYEPQGPMDLMPRCANAVVGMGGICQKPMSRESLPDGRSYLVVDIERGSYADDTAEFVVPEGQIFLLGDNRDNSADSRFAQGAGGMGFVPVENVIGRATRVVFSSAGSHLMALWDWRGERMFKAVE